MEAELGDSLEIDLGGFLSLTRIKLVTPDAVTIANEIIANYRGWRLIKDDNYTKE